MMQSAPGVASSTSPFPIAEGGERSRADQLVGEGKERDLMVRYLTEQLDWVRGALDRTQVKLDLTRDKLDLAQEEVRKETGRAEYYKGLYHAAVPEDQRQLSPSRIKSRSRSRSKSDSRVSQRTSQTLSPLPRGRETRNTRSQELMQGGIGLPPYDDLDFDRSRSRSSLGSTSQLEFGIEPPVVGAGGGPNPNQLQFEAGLECLWNSMEGMAQYSFP